MRILDQENEQKELARLFLTTFRSDSSEMTQNLSGTSGTVPRHPLTSGDSEELDLPSELESDTGTIDKIDNDIDKNRTLNDMTQKEVVWLESEPVYKDGKKLFYIKNYLTGVATPIYHISYVLRFAILDDTEEDIDYNSSTIVSKEVKYIAVEKGKIQYFDNQKKLLKINKSSYIVVFEVRLGDELIYKAFNSNSKMYDDVKKNFWKEKRLKPPETVDALEHLRLDAIFIDSTHGIEAETNQQNLTPEFLLTPQHKSSERMKELKKNSEDITEKVEKLEKKGRKEEEDMETFGEKMKDLANEFKHLKQTLENELEKDELLEKERTKFSEQLTTELLQIQKLLKDKKDTIVKLEKENDFLVGEIEKYKPREQKLLEINEQMKAKNLKLTKEHATTKSQLEQECERTKELETNLEEIQENFEKAIELTNQQNESFFESLRREIEELKKTRNIKL